MQPIERFGVVALVFLIVTIAAVVIWGPEGEESPTAAAEKSTATPTTSSAWRSPSTWRSSAQSASKPATPGWEPDAPLSQTVSSILPSKGSKSGPTERQRENERVLADQELRRQRLDRWSSGAAEGGSTAGAATPPAAAPTAASSALPVPHAAPAGHTADGVYVVRPGDTLSEIALAELGTSKRWTEIRDLNGGLDPAGLRVGMKLRMPAGAGSTAPVGTAAAKPRVNGHGVNGHGTRPASGATYRIQEGDSLWRIAERELGSGLRWREIEQLNPGAATGVLVVGKVLTLPAGAKAAAAPEGKKTLVASAQPTAQGTTGGGRVR